MIITEKELQIFSRQLILKDFTEKNFKFIQKQNVIIVGVGGIGCPVAQYLIATGIKNLTLIDKSQLSNFLRCNMDIFNDLYFQLGDFQLQSSTAIIFCPSGL